jgi:8-oxo-dGTP pyrophosphatase MutT (NUDIX family)
MDYYELGEATYLLSKSAADKPKTSYGLKGKLYASSTGWILLSVPNAIGRGAFDALNAPGTELPALSEEKGYNAHISVIRPEELEAAGLTPDDITERGKEFSYTLGPVRDVNPSGWGEMSRVWFIEVKSPELKTLRKTYGLTPLPKNNEHQFHISFAVRRTGVLGKNPTKKAASANELMKLAADLTPSRVRVAMPHGAGYLMEEMNNPKYPENLGRIRLPGGGIDGDETPEQAAARELKEELGIDVTPELFKRLGIHPDGQHGPEQYLQLDEHGLSPGQYTATVGGDKHINLIEGNTDSENYWGGDLDKLAAYTMVPEGAIEAIKKHGLLSGQSLLNNPEALAAAAAGRGMTADDFKKEIQNTLSGWKPESAQGPNVLFKPPPEDFELPEHHPSKKWQLAQLGVDIDKLLEDQPDTRVHGSELVPYDEEEAERQGDAYASQRHRDLSPEELAELRGRSSEDLWKNMDKTFKGYAANVPHASVITPTGDIPSKYLKFAKEASCANESHLTNANESDPYGFGATKLSGVVGALVGGGGTSLNNRG